MQKPRARIVSSTGARSERYWSLTLDAKTRVQLSLFNVCHEELVNNNQCEPHPDICLVIAITCIIPPSGGRKDDKRYICMWFVLIVLALSSSMAVPAELKKMAKDRGESQRASNPPEFAPPRAGPPLGCLARGGAHLHGFSFGAHSQPIGRQKRRGEGGYRTKIANLCPLTA